MKEKCVCTLILSDKYSLHSLARVRLLHYAGALEESTFGVWGR